MSWERVTSDFSRQTCLHAQSFHIHLKMYTDGLAKYICTYIHFCLSGRTAIIYCFIMYCFSALKGRINDKIRLLNNKQRQNEKKYLGTTRSYQISLTQ